MHHIQLAGLSRLGGVRRAGQPAQQRRVPPVATPLVEPHVAGHSQQPGQRIVLRRVVQPPPRHEERLRHHVVGPVPDDPSVEDIPLFFIGRPARGVLAR
jgi:hypothetical protein